MKRVIYASRRSVTVGNLTGHDFHKFLKSKEASKPIKSVASNLLAQWYNNEGASIEDISREDIIDMCNAADDELDKQFVLYALGWNDSDEFREALEEMGYSEDEIASTMRGR